MGVKRLLLGISVLCIMCLPIGTAGAHEVEGGEDLQGVLHVEPDDNPVAGRPAHLRFTLTHEGEEFSPSDCGCTVTVSQGDKKILSTAASEDVLLILPKPGKYHVTLTGSHDDEQNFSLHFSVEAQAAGNGFSITNRGTQVILFSVATLVVLVVIARRHIIDGGRYKKD